MTGPFDRAKEVYSERGARELLSTLLQGKDPHQKERDKLRRKVHQFDDGKANERVIKLVDELRQ